MLYLVLILIPLSLYNASLSFFTVFVLKFPLSDMNITLPAFFLFPFTWNIFFHPLTFGLCVILALM